MKGLLLFIFSVLISVFGTAQTRNLDYFLEQAQINSPLINKSKNDNKIVNLNLKQIKDMLSKPKISFETDILFAPIISHDEDKNKFELISEGADSYTGYDFAYSDGGQYQTYLSVKQPLLTRSFYNNYSQKAELSVKQNENTIKLTQHELEQLVKHQYLLCLKSEKQAEIAFELYKEMQKSLKILQTLVKNALYSQSDLILMQIEIQNYDLNYKNFLSDYKNNLSDLNALCGINENVTHLEDTLFVPKPDTLIRSHFLTRYTLDSLQILQNQIIFNQNYKPQFYLYADAGMKSIYRPSLNRFGFSTGINLSWTLYDGNQRKIEYKKNEIKLQNLNFEKQNFIIQNDLNKQKYTAQINSLNQRIKITNQQLSDYNKLYKLYLLKLSNAQVSVMDLKNLLKDISDKKQENQLLKTEKQAVINLYNYWNF